MLSARLDFSDVISIVAGGGRMAMVMATCGHFASAVAAHKLGHIAVERADEAPQQSPGDKYRMVIPQSH